MARVTKKRKTPRRKRSPAGAVLRNMAERLQGNGVLGRMRELAVLSRYTNDEEERKRLDSERRHLAELAKMAADREYEERLDRLETLVEHQERLLEATGDDAKRSDMAPPLNYPPGGATH